MLKSEKILLFLGFYSLSGCANSLSSTYLPQPYPVAKTACTCPTKKQVIKNTEESIPVKTPIKEEIPKTSTKENLVSLPKEVTEKPVTPKKEDDLKTSILNKMVEADKNNKVFQATFTNYSKGNFKKEKETFVSAKMTIEKPSKALLNVSDSSDKMAVGSTLLYTGGEKVKVKAAGLLGMIPVSFNIKDDMFANARGHSLLFALEGLERLTHPETKIELTGQAVSEGKKVYVLKVDAHQKPDPEITHEVYGVDSETFIVLYTEMYVNEKLVGQYKIKDIKVNPKLPADFFSL